MDLREYLFENNIRCTDFAKEIGVHRNTIYGIMSGKLSCSIAIAILVEKYTNGKVSRFELPMTDRSKDQLLRSLSHTCEA